MANKLLPITISLKGRHCLIVGGGQVALRKLNNLLDTDAEMDIVSEKFCEELLILAGQNADRVKTVFQPYHSRDLSKYSLVFAATDDEETNRKVFDDAQKSGTFVNIADDSRLSSFHDQAVLRRGDLVISVSTGGSSPALSAAIRKELEDKYSDWYGEYTAALGNIRSDIMERCPDSGLRRRLWAHLAGRDVREMLSQFHGDILAAEMEKEIQSFLGE